MNKSTLLANIAMSGAVFLTGCSILEFGGDIAAVGPSYKEHVYGTNETIQLPDAGLPTTNLTASGEYRRADGKDDTRISVTTNEIASWWKTFNDPVLESLITRACESNRSFKVALQHLIQARANRKAAFAQLLPSLDGLGSATANETSGRTSSWKFQNNSKRFHFDDFRGSVAMSWEIDIFGGRRRELQAATREAEAEVFNVQHVWIGLAADIGETYAQLRTTQKRLDVAITNLAIQTDTLELLESSLASGITDELAVNQARYITEETRASIPALRATEEALLNSLAVYAGEMPGTLHKLLEAKQGMCKFIEPRKIAEIPMETIRQRPDVRAAERRLAAAVSKVGVAEAMLLPRFSLTGSLGLESYSFEQLAKRKALYGAIGPSVNWPLLRGGATLAQIESAKSAVDEAVMNYEKAIQNAAMEVRNAASAYSQEYHRYKSLANAVQAASEASRLAQERYKSGISDFNNVLDAQRSQLTLEEALVISEGTIMKNLITLYKSLGGGFKIQ